MESGLIGDCWLGVGHGQYHGDTSRESGSCPRGEVLFVSTARLAQMDVDVDQARDPDQSSRSHAINVRFHLWRLAHQPQSLSMTTDRESKRQKIGDKSILEDTDYHDR